MERCFRERNMGIEESRGRGGGEEDD